MVLLRSSEEALSSWVVKECWGPVRGGWSDLVGIDQSVRAVGVWAILRAGAGHMYVPLRSMIL